MFVAADPDMIPSLRIQEGDMLVVLNKLASIEEHCAVLQRELHAMRSLVARGPPPNRSVAIIKNANKSREVIVAAADKLEGPSAPISSPRQLSVRPVESDISSAVDSDGEMETDKSQEFTIAESRDDKRRRKKRQRASYSPATQTYASIAAAASPQNATAAAAVMPVKKPGLAKASVRQKRMMIGQSTTSSIRAAKTLNLPKAVFRIGNIDACYSAADVQQHVESLGVRVVSCFERTSQKTRYEDNKTFRIYIFDADKSQLFSVNGLLE